MGIMKQSKWVETGANGEGLIDDEPKLEKSRFEILG